MHKYNIVMFAYNEERNIASSISSVFNNIDDSLHKFYLIANGCNDNTVSVAQDSKNKLQFDALQIISIELGDKCNAWNTYVHSIADEVATHFFVDADVQFSNNCFSKLHGQLTDTEPATVAIAGLPLSGRNLAYYRSLVVGRACFFGNLYGLKHNFIEKIKKEDFHLPIGLNWIDSFLTKAVNTNLTFVKENLPNRTTWLEGVGYSFTSLSIFSKSDIQLYLSRIARYELGKLQEIFLDKLHVSNWPSDVLEINKFIQNDFTKLSSNLSFYKRILVKRRLARILSKYKD